MGMRGAAGLDTPRLLDALTASKATTTIMTPQILIEVIDAMERGGARPALRFLAVGGAPLHPSYLARAAALGLPAYEGYGGVVINGSQVASGSVSGFKSVSAARIAVTGLHTP